ncbi:MAG: carbohydrate kinase family protein [Scandinavium sp.]|uniref:carbohydrate kinase family protein n=1 Tax=Scandinavium sp. TaxID=2830653 RepID=UPI003F406F23
MRNRHGILAIGNLLADRTLRCSEYPRESLLTMVSEVVNSCGGGCTNVLFDLAKLDPQLPLSLCGKVGRDELGQFILQQAHAHHIDTHQVKITDSDETSFTDVMINKQNGHRTFFHFMGANQCLSVNDFNGLNSQARIAHVAYLLLLPGLEQDDEQFGTTGARALYTLQQQGFRVSLDLISASNTDRYQRWVVPALPYVDYLIINDEEARQLTATSSESTLSYLQQAALLLEKGVRQLVCIHYPQGATVMTREGENATVSAYQVADCDVVSTLGAGDAFCAGMLYGIHQQWSLVDTLRLGCASARFNLFSVSATEGAVSLSELEEFIHQKEFRL